MTRNQSNKRVSVLKKIDKTLLKDIKEDLNVLGNESFLRIRKTNIIKMNTVSKLIIRFNAIPIKNSVLFKDFCRKGEMAIRINIQKGEEEPRQQSNKKKIILNLSN